ncbi:MAG: peptide chain release factor 1 [bacterium]|nr:peptide chain release factor 1 [bacterium]
MINRLETMLNKYNDLTKELSKPEVISNIKQLTSLSKEQNSLKETVNLYLAYKQVLKDIEDAKELAKDKELGEFAKEELTRLNLEKDNLEHNLEVQLLPKDPNDEKNVIMEIKGAAGGDEANIFAGDLFDMYNHYASTQNWKIEILNSIEGTSGGFTNIEFIIKGDNVYSKLKYESGAHRVQRVPATESQGRVHTSTATVLVMPEAEDIDVDIREEDIKVDIFRSSGPGGQGVNTTDSAVRLTHLPTGIVVTCQNERSQIKNKEAAMKTLKTKIWEVARQKQEEENDNARRIKIGTGDRSEKIRTYNYPQNRVTDHRIGFTSMNLDKIMAGNLETIILELINANQIKELENNG